MSIFLYLLVFKEKKSIKNEIIDFNRKFFIKNLENSFFCCNICAHKVQQLIEMLSRKAEGLDPLKP